MHIRVVNVRQFLCDHWCFFWSSQGRQQSTANLQKPQAKPNGLGCNYTKRLRSGIILQAAISRFTVARVCGLGAPGPLSGNPATKLGQRSI